MMGHWVMPRRVAGSLGTCFHLRHREAPYKLFASLQLSALKLLSFEARLSKSLAGLNQLELKGALVDSTALVAGNALPATSAAMEIILSYLEAEGVRYAFGVSGGTLVPMYEALRARNLIRPILAKHEGGAAFMADGYARVSRSLGVCCSIGGPGATNALTGIACAYADSVPVMLLSGHASTSTFGTGPLQESNEMGVDLVSLFRPVTKLSTMLIDPATVPTIIQRAIRTALSGRPGPVHINVPVNVAKKQIAHQGLHPQQYRPHSAYYDPRDISFAAELVMRARHPCIIAGHGVNVSGAWQALACLAEAFQIPVATTPKGKGVFPEDHPLSLGVLGLGGHATARRMISSSETDLLLILGTSLGEFQTNGWDSSIGAGKTLIQVDIDPRELTKNYPVALAAVADIGAAVSALEGELRRRAYKVPEDAGLRLEGLRRETGRWSSAERMLSEQTPILPQRLFAEMQRCLPQNALLFMDMGNCVSWLVHYYTVRKPGTFFTDYGLGSMGYALPAAIGGQLAAPEASVVAVMGDGAFAMTGLEFHTAVEQGLPVIAIVLNDGGFGMVRQGETLMLGAAVSPSTYQRVIDACAVARGLGGAGYRVSSPAEFAEALRSAIHERQPAVIDVRIDRDEVPASLGMRNEVLTTMMRGKR
jgi:acetolactate synthase I/II/III large subunit